MRSCAAKRARDWHNLSATETAEWIVLEENRDVQLVDVELIAQHGIQGEAGDSLRITLLRREVVTAAETTLRDLEISALAKGESFSLGRKEIFSDPLGVARGPIAFVVRARRSSGSIVGSLRTIATFVAV